MPMKNSNRYGYMIVDYIFVVTKYEFMDGRSRAKITNKYAFYSWRAGLKLEFIIYVENQNIKHNNLLLNLKKER